MLGNFSFGDYFKAEAIPWAWELVTEVLGLDGDRLWVTVHDDRRRGRGDLARRRSACPPSASSASATDNFWQMGDTGPCGPCSEIFCDCGPAFGPDGGPASRRRRPLHRDLEPRVHAVRPARPTARWSPLPKPSIDTGAGLERNLGAAAGRRLASGTPTCCRRSSTRPQSRHRPRATATPTSDRRLACGSSPSTPAR